MAHPVVQPPRSADQVEDPGEPGHRPASHRIEEPHLDLRVGVGRGEDVVYTPWFWWGIMALIRALPDFLFKRMQR